MDKTKIAAVDLGNTRVKVLTINDYLAFEYSRDWAAGLINKFISDNVYFIALASVNKEREAELLDACHNRISVLKADTLIRKSNLIDFSDIEGMGDDRKLSLFGALYLDKIPAITIDCGTACTINIIDGNKKCLGGAIFCGMQTQARALNKFTSKLPLIDIHGTEIISGKDTEQAINLGIINSTVGAIKEFVKLINENYFPEAPAHVIITGGGAQIILPKLKELNINYEPELVLKGLFNLALEN